MDTEQIHRITELGEHGTPLWFPVKKWLPEEVELVCLRLYREVKAEQQR